MTASDVAESAVPAIREALSVQSSRPKATSDPTTNGPMKGPGRSLPRVELEDVPHDYSQA
jgi:hypothetical protein